MARSRSFRSHGFVAALAGLVALRVAVPLAALADSGHALPGLPRYTYGALSGDATGFYAAAREFISAARRLGLPLLAAFALELVAAAAVGVWLWRRAPARRHWAVVLVALAVSLAVSAAIGRMHPPGAAVFGWPLLWSVAMLPARALGVLGPRVAFGLGLALSLVANAVTVVATAAIGLRATGRRSVALLAPALLVAWPLLTGVVAGHRGWANGTWEIDTGLHLYTEPLSTALVTVALALLLRPEPTPLALALAGTALSYATLVKLSDGILAAVLLLVLAARVGRRRALPFLAGGLTFAPAVAAYWPKGYVPIFNDPTSFPPTPFALAYAGPNWLHSLLFSPRTLAVLVPVAALGALAVRSRYARALLVLPVLVNAALYTFYANTIDHPRFLFVGLPAVFVLWAAGAELLALGVRKVGERRQEQPVSSPP